MILRLFKYILWLRTFNCQLEKVKSKKKGTFNIVKWSVGQCGPFLTVVKEHKEILELFSCNFSEISTCQLFSAIWRHGTDYILQRTFYRVHCQEYTLKVRIIHVHCTVYMFDCAYSGEYNLQSTIPWVHWQYYTSQSTLQNTQQSILYNVRCVPYFVKSTSPLVNNKLNEIWNL